MDWVADGGVGLYWPRSTLAEIRHRFALADDRLRTVASSDVCRVGRGDEPAVRSLWWTQWPDVVFEPPKQLTDKDGEHSESLAHLPPMWDRPRIANVGF